jgi:hypothetical protein
MEAINMQARVDAKGRVVPRHFTWRDQEIDVDGVGRRWQDESGEHILVMAQPGDSVYELLHDADEKWWLVRAFGHPVWGVM